MELDNLLIEEKLSEADQESEMTTVRYTADEVFGRAKMMNLSDVSNQ